MIDKTYIVNLARRQDKRKHMENELNKLKNKGVSMNHVFFNAIDGSDANALSKIKFHAPNWFDPNSGKAMTNGEVGCALSHYLIWEDIVRQVEAGDLPKTCLVLILEDDIVFLEDFMDKFKQYTGEIKHDYDMLYVHRKPLNLESETKKSLHINCVRKSYWTCGYILTYRGAKKLVNSKYLDNLIPVDEFLPLMYGCEIYGYEKMYESCEKLKCYAICPSLLKLTGTAFTDSETFHSQPFIDNSRYKFDNNKEFVMVYTGPTKGHSYERFMYYCKLYALPCIILDSRAGSTDIQTLAKELRSWSTEKLASVLLLVISVYPLDYCNIIPIASPAEIINKYMDITNRNENHIVSSKKDSKNKKILFCGWAKRVMQLLEMFKDNNSMGGSLATLLTASSLQNKDVIYDTKCEIFQVLAGNDSSSIAFDHKSSRLVNSKTKTNPAIIISNDSQSNILLNRTENYTGNNWNEFYGYRVSSQTNNRAGSKIYLSFLLEDNRNILKIINMLDYPKDLITVRTNRVNRPADDNKEKIYITEEEFFEKDILNFLASDCDYYFYVGPNYVHLRSSIIQDLLNMNKDVVAPLMRRGNESWTNFWGDLDEKGYYKRAPDYFDIIEYKRQGCWNVPYITGTYLIKRNVLELVPQLFTDYDDMDPDMRMCRSLRENDIFMYVTNMEKYGYIAPEDEVSSPEKPTTVMNNAGNNSAVIETNGELTIYDIPEKRDEWEKKYLHPEFYERLNNLEKLECTEVCDGIYNFPLFSEAFCREIIQRAEAYGKWSKGKDEHNDPRLGKNYYENVPTVDVQLFELKMDKQWKEIVNLYIAPMAKVLYNNYKTKDINLAFVVKYSHNDQRALAPHHDASTYTVNIALNKGNGVEYEGGGCRFIRQNYVLKNQPVGMCCMHPGRLTAYHEGLAVTSGVRFILVSFIN